VPGIRGISLQATAERAYLEAQIVNGRPGTQMPAWGRQAGGLLPDEIGAVLDYLRPAEAQRGALTSARTLALPARGDAVRGAVLYSTYCSGCHGVAGHGGIAPELANPVFQKAASDEFIITTIRNGRRNSAMASFQPQIPGAAGLSDAQLGDLLAFLRTLGGPQAAAPSAKASETALPAQHPAEALR
jgi:mono/diheme cytochrome c family protein